MLCATVVFADFRYQRIMLKMLEGSTIAMVCSSVLYMIIYYAYYQYACVSVVADWSSG